MTKSSCQRNMFLIRFFQIAAIQALLLYQHGEIIITLEIQNQINEIQFLQQMNDPFELPKVSVSQTQISQSLQEYQISILVIRISERSQADYPNACLNFGGKSEFNQVQRISETLCLEGEKSNISKLKSFNFITEQIKNYSNVSNQLKGALYDLGSSFEHNNSPTAKDNLEIEKEFNKQFEVSKTTKLTKFQSFVRRILTNNFLKIKKSKWNTILTFTIRPSNPLAILCQTLKAIIIVHTFFSFPMTDAFGQAFIDREHYYFSDIIRFEFFFQLFDIALHFNMVIYQQGEIIYEKRKIAKIYLQKDFFLDIVALFGFFFERYPVIIFQNDDNISSNNPYLEILKYVFFINFRQLKRFVKLFHHEIDPKNKYKSQIELMKLLLLVIIMAHIIASFWIGIGFYSNSHEANSWIESQDLLKHSWDSIYIRGLYFACMTMTTVGYGDIVPKTDLEHLACIGIMLLACGIFAFTLNTITSILQNINKAKLNYKEDCENIKNYMLKKNIDNNLQKRVKQYIKLVWKFGQKESQNSEAQVFQKLNKHLQYNLQIQDKGKQLLSIPFLVNNFSVQFIKALMDKIVEVYCQPEETIINEQLGNTGFYIIFSGEVEIIFNNRVLQTLKSGDHFGLAELFENQKKLTFKSKFFTALYYISFDSFLNCMSQDDFEIFSMLKVQRGEKISIRCPLCLKNGHYMVGCEEISFIPSKSLVISRFNSNKQMERQSFLRKSLKFNTLMNQIQVNSHAIYFQDSSESSQSDSQKSEIDRFEDSSNKSWNLNISENKEFNLITNLQLLESSQIQVRKKECTRIFNQQSQRGEEKSQVIFITPEKKQIRKQQIKQKVFQRKYTSINAMKQIRKQERLKQKEIIFKNGITKVIESEFGEFIFDAMKSFKLYFSNFNYDNVIKIINRARFQKSMSPKIKNRGSRIQKYSS